jgi:hypothetical protein
MEQVALNLARSSGWTYLGGDAEARKDLELVVRAFDQDVEIVLGEDSSTPGSGVVRVPAGEGRRLVGRHFFARATRDGACRISRRGL